MQTTDVNLKPPKGLKPKWLHDEERYEEICAAIERYTEADSNIPKDWLDEKHELESKLKARLNPLVKDNLYE